MISGPNFRVLWRSPDPRGQILEASDLKFGTMVYLYVKILPVKVTFPSGQKLWAHRTPTGARLTTDHIFGPVTMKFLVQRQLFLPKDIGYSDFKAGPNTEPQKTSEGTPKHIGQGFEA